MKHESADKCSQCSPRPSMTLLIVVTLFLGSIVSAPISFADQCTVPGTHDTIQAAVFDPGCNPIDLSDSTFEESVLIHRSLSLRGVNGGSTTIEGQLRVAEPGTEVILGDLIVRSGCPDFTMDVETGAEVISAVVVAGWATGLPCPALVVPELFADGFETGNTSAWSLP